MMDPQQQNEDFVDVNLESKRLLFQRCVKSIGLSIIIQLELVIIFALIVNFSIFEPFSSLWETKEYLFYFGTWMSLFLLLAATIMYFVVLEKYNLYPKVYFRNRARWFYTMFLTKFAFFILHAFVGYFTVVHVSRYLHQDYQNFIINCYDVYCFNTYYSFITSAAIFAACYYFFKENASKDPVIIFPIIQERKLVQIRSLLTLNAKSFVKTAVLPFIYFLVGYILSGWYISRKLAGLLGVEIDDHINSGFHLITNVRLLFYTFLIMAVILTNMNLMQKFSSILLTEEIDFVIDCSQTAAPQTRDVYRGITLVEALDMESLPIMQTLAASRLYDLCSSKSSAKRQEIFALTSPGGHPYTWKRISEVSLKLIKNYTDDLLSATESNPAIPTNWCQPGAVYLDYLQEQKMSIRRFNKARGIRDLSELTEEMAMATSMENAPIETTPPNTKMPNKDPWEEFSKKFYAQVNMYWNHFFSNFPGLHYCFGEEECAKINFLLANSQTVLLLIQGMAGICAVSKHEDRYGVVQTTLPEIISSILRLKQVLEKLQNLHLNGKKVDINYRLLMQAVKRSLYKLCESFGDYMNDILSEPNELRAIQGFLHFREL